MSGNSGYLITGPSDWQSVKVCSRCWRWKAYKRQTSSTL